MDEAEVNRLCEELSALIELEAGIDADALSRARWAIATLRSTELGDYANERLDRLADGFEQWFSFDKWNSDGDRGQLVKRHLEDELIRLRAAMWRLARGEGDS
jgi:hypothetical protein